MRKSLAPVFFFVLSLLATQSPSRIVAQSTHPYWLVGFLPVPLSWQTGGRLYNISGPFSEGQCKYVMARTRLKERSEWAGCITSVSIRFGSPSSPPRWWTFTKLPDGSMLFSGPYPSRASCDEGLRILSGSQTLEGSFCRLDVIAYVRLP